MKRILKGWLAATITAVLITGYGDIEFVHGAEEAAKTDGTAEVAELIEEADGTAEVAELIEEADGTAEVAEIIEEADSAVEMAELLNIDDTLSNVDIYTDNPRFALKRLILIADDLQETYGATDIAHYDAFDEYVLTFATAEATEQAYYRIQADYGKDNCFPDELIETDDMLMDMEGIEPVDALSWGVSYMGMDYLKAEYDYYDINKEVTVAIIDSGINPNHDIFSGRIDTENSYNFYSGNSNIIDNIGHGTHVAGIIAGATPENVQLMVLRCFDDDYKNDYSYSKICTTAITTALEHAIETDADVINMSLGWNGTNAETYHFLDELIDRASSQGIVICCAAGNKKADVRYAYPANNHQVLTVTAMDKSGKFSESYSNYGFTVDYAAPGTNVLSNYLNGEQVMSGTSMAAPHMAAAVAYIKMVEADADTMTVEQRLSEYAVDLGDRGWDDYYGNGYVNLHTYFDDMKLSKRGGGTIEPNPDKRPWQEKVTPILSFKSKTVNKSYGSADFTNELSDNSDGLISYTSSDTKVARVNSSGVVHIVGSGHCTITAEIQETDKFFGRKVSFILNVAKTDLARKTIKLSKTAYTYQGRACKPSVVIKGISADNYTVKYSGYNRVGTAKVTITGKENCTGTVVLTYKIKLAKAKLKSTKNAAEGVSLRWSRIKGATGYRVYRKTGNSSYKCIAKIAGGTKVSYVDKKAKAGKKYKYVVRAVKGRTLGSAGNSRSITRLDTTTVKAANKDAGIKVRWSSVKYATGYRIYKSTDNKNYKIIANVKSPTTSYIDTKAVTGTRNRYIVIPYKGTTRAAKSAATRAIRRR
ncbi:MAG: S8 family serine peptidase [Coprococcus sp.]|nr:S8 family serine peptidase [Coprococcus sp.]